MHRESGWFIHVLQTDTNTHTLGYWREFICERIFIHSHTYHPVPHTGCLHETSDAYVHKHTHKHGACIFPPLTDNTDLVHGALQPRIHGNPHLSQKVQASLSFQLYCLWRKSGVGMLKKTHTSLAKTAFLVSVFLFVCLRFRASFLFSHRWKNKQKRNGIHLRRRMGSCTKENLISMDLYTRAKLSPIMITLYFWPVDSRGSLQRRLRIEFTPWNVINLCHGVSFARNH